MNQAFILSGTTDITEKNLTSVGLGSWFLIGSEKGVISVYEFKQVNERLNKLAYVQQQSFSNSKIEQILVPQNSPVAYVLTNGEVKIIQIAGLHLLAEFKHKDQICAIGIDESDKCQTEFMTISKKKKIRFYKFEISEKKVIEIQKEKEWLVEEIPEMYLWFESYVCYYRPKNKKVIWWNINTGKTEFDENVVKNLKYVNNSLLARYEQLGVFLENSIPKTITPLSFASDKIIDYIGYKSYIISLSETSLDIYTRSDDQSYSLVQQMPWGNDIVGKYLLHYNKKVLFIGSNNQGYFKVFEIEETKFNLQVENLINEGKYEEALKKWNENVSAIENDKPHWLEQYYWDCAWMCLKNKNFQLAYQYATWTNFNPFEFIYMFFSSLGVKILHKDFEENIKKDLTKNQIPLVGDKDDMKAQYKFLIDLLRDKRDYIWSNFDFPKHNLTKIKDLNFTESNNSWINLSQSTADITIIDMINCINLTLVKARIKLKQSPKEISSVIDSDKFFTESGFDFTKDEFFTENNTDECKFALAYYYEKQRNFEKALEIWKQFGVNEKGDKGQIFSHEAKNRTKNIFNKFRDETRNKEKNLSLFQNYIQWMLTKFPEDAFEVVINNNYVSIEYFLGNILNTVETSNKSLRWNLREKFWAYYNERMPNEQYQTMLLEVYLEKWFQLKRSDMDDEILFEGELKMYYETFWDLLKKENRVYSKNRILDKIRGTWLIDAEIFWYSELKQYDNALNKWLDLSKIASVNKKQVMKFDKIEKYCEDSFANKPDIFVIFFQKLVEEYEKSTKELCKLNQMKREIRDLEGKKEKTNELINKNLAYDKMKEKYLTEIKAREDEKKMPYQNEMIHLLQHYGEIGKLDPVVVLSKMPDDIIFSNDAWYKYVVRVIKDYTSWNDKYKIARNLSDMALTYKEKEVLEVKNRSIILENETICELCRKKIGNTIFVVYPNMKVYHTKCAANTSICPITRVDFTKKSIV